MTVISKCYNEVCYEGTALYGEVFRLQNLIFKFSGRFVMSSSCRRKSVTSQLRNSMIIVRKLNKIIDISYQVWMGYLLDGTFHVNHYVFI